MGINGRGMLGRGIRQEFVFPIPLPKIPLQHLPGATKRAHSAMITYQAEMPHLMAGSILNARNPCKHWSKWTPGASV